MNRSQANHRFSVFAHGLDRRDRGMLERAFRLAEGRVRSYDLADTATAADIILISAADTTGWPQHGPHQALVLVQDAGAPGVSAPGHYSLTRPLLAPRVLRLLDDVTLEALGFTPELSVGAVNTDDGIGSHSGVLQQRIRARLDVSDLAQISALVVDDSLMVRKQMELILGTLCLSLHSCASG